MRSQHRPACVLPDPSTQDRRIIHSTGLEPPSVLARLRCTLLRAAIGTLDRKTANRCSRAARANSEGSAGLHALSSAVGSTSVGVGKLHRLRNQNDAGGRTVQVLPRETHTTGQIRRQRITITTKSVSLYTPSTLRRENRAQKHINNPHVQEARTQDIQYDAGHPNRPTIHQVHASYIMIHSLC